MNILANPFAIFGMKTKSDILKKAAREGVPEAISFLINNYIQAVYFFILIRSGEDIFLAKSCVERVFKIFFESIANSIYNSNLENILLNISEQECSHLLFQFKIGETYPYCMSKISWEDWHNLRILRDLPYNYHWLLVKFFTKTQNFLDPSSEDSILERAIAMYETAIWENHSSIKKFQDSLERLAYTKEEKDAFLKKHQEYSWEDKKIFSFFLSFSSFLIIFLFACYLAVLYHFPDIKNEFRVFFLMLCSMIVLSLFSIKAFICIKKNFIRKKWEKNFNIL